MEKSEEFQLDLCFFSDKNSIQQFLYTRMVNVARAFRCMSIVYDINMHRGPLRAYGALLTGS